MDKLLKIRVTGLSGVCSPANWPEYTCLSWLLPAAAGLYPDS